jgi:Hsp20/alpha crystallin family
MVQVKLDKNGVITIEGERQSLSEDGKGNFKRMERTYGSFVRRYALSLCRLVFLDILLIVRGMHAWSVQVGLIRKDGN